MYFFVSSTFSDLRREREKVQEALRKGDASPWGMEFFVSEPRRALDVCLNEIDRCDAVILLVGSKAGSLVPADANLTYTEAEIEHAKRRNLPIFAFVKRVEGQLPNDHPTTDPLHEQLREFREAIIRSLTPGYFDSLDQLGLQVLASVVRWESAGRPGARRVFAGRDEFFQVDARPGVHLRHDVPLHGRSGEIATLDTFASDQRLLLVLTAEGGAGKSKLLHDWSSTVQNRSVLFVKPGAVWHADATRELPVGNVLIVLDDAHQAPHLIRDLILLTNEQRANGRDVKLILATRPSGRASVDASTATRVAAGDVSWLELRRLSLEDRRRLAEAVLGPAYHGVRDHLVDLAGDSPLVIVVGGRLISDAGVEPRQLLNATDFRHEVLNRFVAELGTEADAWRPLLNLLALVGPAHVQSDTFEVAAAQVVGLPKDEVLRGIRILLERGLAVQRSGRIRVTPDVLADHLIRIVAATPDGHSTGYVERVFGAFGLSYLDNLLANGAELAWRLREERSQPTAVLDPVWRELTNLLENAKLGRSTVLKAVRRAAIYEPRQAFELAKRAATLNPDDWDQDEIMEIIRVASYDPAHTAEAVRLLWGRTKSDQRRRNSYPSHAGRVLTELAAWGPYKAVEFNARILELAQGLMSEGDAFSTEFTPLDIADSALKHEGEDTEGTDTGITIRAFALNYPAVQSARSRAVGMVREALFMADQRAQSRAMKSVTSLLHPSLPSFGRIVSDQEREWQDRERLVILEIVEGRLHSKPSAVLHFAIHHELEKAVRWSSDMVENRIAEIISRSPVSDQALAISAVCVPAWDEPGEHEDGEDERKNGERLARALKIVRGDALSPEEVLHRFEELVSEATAFGVIDHQAAANTCTRLCMDNDGFLNALIDRAFSSPESVSCSYLSLAVLCLSSTDLPRFREIVRRALDSLHEQVTRAGVHGLSMTRLASPIGADLDLFVLGRDKALPGLRRWLLREIGRIGASESELRARAIATLVTTPLQDEKSADDVCLALEPLRNFLTERDIQAVLSSLLSVPKLDEYHVGKFLEDCASRRAGVLLDFMLGRLREASSRRRAEDYSYRAAPDYLRRRDLSGVRNAESYGETLRKIRNRLRADEVSESEVARLFWRVAGLDAVALSVLDEWLHEGETEIELLARLLDDCNEPVALKQPLFAMHAYSEAQSMNAAVGDRVSAALVHSSLPHQWSGTPGAVPPVFIERENDARRLATQMSGIRGAEVFGRIAEILVTQGRTHAENVFQR